MFSRWTSVALLVGLTVLGGFAAGTIGGGEPAGDAGAVEDEVVRDAGAASRGYRFLTEKPYLPIDFTEEAFAAIWQSWPEPLRSEAAAMTPEERRRVAFERYGLTERPLTEPTGDERPLQYVVDAEGQWTMNCFSCHGGSVYGTPYPGAPNNGFALQTLTEEIRRTKLRIGEPLTRMDLGSLLMPLGTTVGRTNAVMFGVAVMHYRDEALNVLSDVGPPQFTHHDMDAPPWWHFYKRPNIYIDGFAERGHRGLMQFMLVRENGPEKFREWEADFRDVYAYLMSLRPPVYEGPIDERLAEQGRVVFEASCAECHGTYGAESAYPNRVVAIEELGTDPVRLAALPAAGRAKYGRSWFAHAGEPEQQQTVVEPDGYLAPPLDGVWASPPYFHNGSVPTLWHVLHPEERPVVWRRSAVEIDSERIGFQIEEVDRVPLDEPDIAVRRQYFDTRQLGKSAAGHDFPSALSEAERRAVLEYLKTL
ncbi:c-type cytochrome [Candidatus Laterigemmans baculatus]|uniref:c-type cytochrome n=1 Tax=Candidatus Laterigemmans baculatus TaxID=2770505 RepID=UPI0013DB0D3F|nr:hypothetical protein [Candidatus Laterigemmans baculatus]